MAQLTPWNCGAPPYWRRTGMRRTPDFTEDSLGCLNGNWKLFVFTIERSVFLCSFVVVSGRDGFSTVHKAGGF